MGKELQKVHISIDMEPSENDRIHTRAHFEGATDDIVIAYIELSKRLLNTLEENHGKEFTTAVYAVAQNAVLKESCLKESYEQHEKVFKRIEPLMNIFGKTFKMPRKDGEEE